MHDKELTAADVAEIEQLESELADLRQRERDLLDRLDRFGEMLGWERVKP